MGEKVSSKVGWLQLEISRQSFNGTFDVVAMGGCNTVVIAANCGHLMLLNAT